MYETPPQHEPPTSTGIRSTPSAASTRLASFSSLSTEEKCALRDTSMLSRSVRAGDTVACEGEPPGSIHFLADGWACRFKLHRDGRRQISTLLAPGDVCNLDGLLFARLDYGVSMLTAGTVLSLPRNRALTLAANHPGIARGFTWLAFVENAALAQWAICLGQYSARERVAHLYCELATRLGCDDEGEISFDLPLTQEYIADVLGLTPVHVNRTLHQLRSDGLLTSSLHKITIPDVTALRQVADFDPRYLHIGDTESMPSVNV